MPAALGWIWRAWHRLEADRPRHGGGFGPAIPGPIPWSLVLRWADYQGLTQGEMQLLDQCLLGLHAEDVAHWLRRQPKPPPARG